MKSDRIVLVTGAAGGIGSKVVERFLANGDTVIATDKNEAGLAALATHERLTTVVGDFTDEAACQAIVDSAKAAGGLDVLVNVAGWYPIQPFDELSADDFRQVVDTNLTGPFLMIRAAWPVMKGRGWGRIVIVGSASTYEGVPDQLPYVSAKAGLFGLARSFAKVAGAEGVTVNVVTPGLTSTAPVKQNVPAKMIEAASQARVLKREEQAPDLVGAIFFLASPDADFITAQTINVDGGAHMI